jgi:hypothetical protein
MRTVNHVRRSLLRVLLLMLLAFVTSAALSIAVILKADHEDYRNNLARAKQLEIDAKAGRPKPPETPKSESNKPSLTTPSSSLTASLTSSPTSLTALDSNTPLLHSKYRKAYQREYMRQRRAAAKTHPAKHLKAH